MQAGLLGELFAVAPALRPTSTLRDSWHILEEDVVPELQRLLRSHSPGRSLRHGGGVVMGGAAGGIWLVTRHDQVSSFLRLGELSGRDRLRAAEEGKVRIVRAPAAELVRLLTHASIAFPPP